MRRYPYRGKAPIDGHGGDAVAMVLLALGFLFAVGYLLWSMSAEKWLSWIWAG